jgi:hypothetical protein
MSDITFDLMGCGLYLSSVGVVEHHFDGVMGPDLDSDGLEYHRE